MGRCRTAVAVLLLAVAPPLVVAPAASGGAAVSGAGTWARPAALAAAVAAVAATAWLLRRRSGPKGPPVVARLFIHPVKSCRPIEVQALHLDKLGVANDRRWAIVDMSQKSDSRVVTTRNHAQLALIVPSLPNAEADPSTDAGRLAPLTLSAPGMPALEVPRPSVSANTLEFELWAVPGTALDCGDDAAKWLNSFLGAGSLRLAYLSDDVGSEAPVKSRDMCKQEAWNGGNEADSVYLQGTRVGFADSADITVISQSSLQDLGSRLSNSAVAQPERFRMNVVLAGTRAYEEEMWKSFQLGAIAFVVSRLCNRCIVTLVDPSTGEKGPTKGEPLQVLRSYRSPKQLWRVDPRHKEAPILGTKAHTRATAGTIRVGDLVSAAALREEGDRMY